MALSVINSSPSMGLGGASYNSTNLLQPASWPSTTTGTQAQPVYDQPYSDPYAGYSAPAASQSYGTSYSTYTPPAPVIDYNALAQYDQSIGNTNAAIGRLDPQQQVGMQNIDTGYNQALNSLLQSNATNQQAYDTSKTQTAQDYVGAKNTIGSNAGSSLNGLLRLLGSRGAGGSSAALFNAPQDVALQASQQRAGAGQTFGRNNQALDTSWNQYQTGFKNDRSNLDSQRTNSQNSLKAQTDSTRANLLQSLATLQGQRASVAGGNPVSAAQPYLDQANNYLNDATQLGAQVPTYAIQPTTYAAPSISSYSTNPFATPQSQNNALSTSVSPSLAFLLGGQKDKTQLSAF